MDRPSPQAKPRILVNALHAKSGGGVTYLRNILPLLAEDERLDLHLLLHSDQLPLLDSLDDSVTRHIVALPASLAYQILWEQIAVPFKARLLAADVTFSPANFGPLFAPTPVIMLRNAVTVGKNEPRLKRRLYWKTMAAMTAACLATCHRAIAVSQYASTSLGFARRNRRENKIAVVHHGVNPLFTPGEKAPDVEPYLLVVADIYIQKNFETLLEALPAIIRRFPALHLKIAGRQTDAFYYDRVIRSIVRLKLEDSVRLLGHKNDNELLRLYRDCAVFVLPSTVETFGNPLLEAMACAAPVACSNTAAMPEIAGDGALLFDPLNAKDMAEKILQLLENPALAGELARKGHERSNLFSWHKTARQTADVLLDAASRTASNQGPRRGREKTGVSNYS